MFSPLEQFDLVRVKSFILHDIFFLSNNTYFDFSFFNIFLPFIVIILLVRLLIYFMFKKLKLIPLSIWQVVLESLYLFVYDIIKQQIGSKGFIYFPLIFTLFNFVLLSNLFSLVPFGIALTSHIIVIFYLSVTLCLSIFFIGLLTHNLKFLKIFIPECPFFLLLILIPIEIFSYVIRMFSLSIRLAANILAGHTLVFIVTSFILKIITKIFKINFINLFLFSIPLIFLLFVVLFAILVLEFGVAFLQAYVFTILVCIYLSDALNLPAH